MYTISMHIKNISAKTSKWTLIVFLLYTGILTVLKNVEIGNPPMIQDLTERQIFYFQIQQYYGYLQQMYIFILAALVYFEKKICMGSHVCPHPHYFYSKYYISI